MELDPKTVMMQPAGHVARDWQVRVPAGISFGDIFKPSTWAAIESLMRQRGGGKRPATGDLIRCISSDGSFDATCLVQSVSNGYALRFYSGIRPAPLPQVMADLDALPEMDAAEIKDRARNLSRRSQAMGASRDDLGTARRRFAKETHPDAGAADGKRLAAANAILDHALANLPEAA